jgi:predicted metal-dependent hydrolase
MDEMKVRTPRFDFSNTRARWSPVPEFAQMMNASSLWIPHLERFLNRVLAKALTELKGDDEKTRQLRRDVRTFIRQEANHYTLHGAFNEAVKRDGYDLEPFEKYFVEQFDELLATRSLPFLCAYCEGFETIGPPAAVMWLDRISSLIEGADPEVVGLWKWHLVEEYEHRTVCFDVFKAIHGGYFMRMKGFFFQLKQLGGFSKMVRKHLLEKDYANMSPSEIRASQKRLKQVSRKLAMVTLPRLAKALSPFYTPRNAREPVNWRAQRAIIEANLA